MMKEKKKLSPEDIKYLRVMMAAETKEEKEHEYLVR